MNYCLKRIFISLLIVGLISLASLAKAEGNSPTKEQMLAIVKEAVAHVKKVEKEQALKDFSDKKGNFVRFNGELYLYAYDFKCVNLAHGAKPELIGKDLTSYKDSSGMFVIQQLRDTAKFNSLKCCKALIPECLQCAKDLGENKEIVARNGFLNFHWDNPATGKDSMKLGYVEKVDDTFWVGSGIYLSDKTDK
ncbi:MAG: cache domain-containing protein [Deltaproteobacteria bacterium]|nr:cache domain-containing protein [Deltaproteobacteria bacterium]